MAAENHQERLYNLLDQLQRMARELPTKYEYNILDIYQQLVSRYQQRIPYDLLAELAASLAQGQIFEIVKMLTEVCPAEIILCKAMKQACPLVRLSTCPGAAGDREALVPAAAAVDQQAAAREADLGREERK